MMNDNMCLVDSDEMVINEHENIGAKLIFEIGIKYSSNMVVKVCHGRVNSNRKRKKASMKKMAEIFYFSFFMCLFPNSWYCL